MAIKKSKPYLIDGSKYSFEFDDDGKLIGAKKQDENGNFKPVDPASNEFVGLELSDQALNAYNINKHGGNTSAYEETLDISPDLLKQQLYDNEEKKSNNQQFLEDNTLNKNTPAFTTPQSPSYQGFKTGSSAGFFGRNFLGKSDVMAYPADIDLEQDHFKITRYNYARPDVNQSKPSQNKGGYYAKVAGDGVKGSKIMGSVILPMPKPIDVYAAEWGKSELNISQLAALGAANALTFGGRLTGKTPEQRQEEALLRNEAGRRDQGGLFGRGKMMSQALIAQSLSNQAAKMFNTELDTDVFLARTGGKVLNPNAEVLFEGPTIRSFPFQFQMIARSEDEGKEIRKIIKFLKEGMAPKFRHTTFIDFPDIFTLAYKNGKGDEDILKTVNRFSPGGLALTNLNVDYAPSGYWSAYRDSQPVAVKVDMTFTELRPLYEVDQTDLKGDNVGY